MLTHPNPNPNHSLTLMTQDTPPNTRWNTIKKVNVTYFFGYRNGLGGMWGFGSLHGCANSSAKMRLYYHQDSTIALLQHCQLHCHLDCTRTSNAIVPYWQYHSHSVFVYGLSNSSSCSDLECPWRLLLCCKPDVKFSTLVASMEKGTD